VSEAKAEASSSPVPVARLSDALGRDGTVTTVPDARTNRPQHRTRRTGPSDFLVLPTVFIVGCLLTLLRSPSTLLRPELWAEDGVVWFHDAYTFGWFGPLRMTDAGYLQTFSRLIADVGLLVPLDQVPRLFTLAALVVQVLPAVLIASKRYAGVVGDYRVRVALAVLYLAVPNSFEINADLTNAQWHLALLAGMVVLAAPPGRTGKAFDLGVILLSGLTGPFVLSLLVITIILYACRRQMWTLILGVLIALTGIIQTIELLTTSSRGQNGPLGMSLPRLVEILGGALFGNTILGASMHTAYFRAHALLFSSLILVVVLAVMGLASWHGPLELKLFNLFATLVLIGTLASPAATTKGSQWQALSTAAGTRYWFLPSLAFLVDLIWLAGQVWSGRRTVGVLSLVILAAVCLLGVRTDFRYPNMLAPAWGPQVQRFEKVPPGTTFTFVIRPGWHMTLTKK
jgi:hypothetical protein